MGSSGGRTDIQNRHLDCRQRPDQDEDVLIFGHSSVVEVGDRWCLLLLPKGTAMRMGCWGLRQVFSVLMGCVKSLFVV